MSVEIPPTPIEIALQILIREVLGEAPLPAQLPAQLLAENGLLNFLRLEVVVERFFLAGQISLQTLDLDIHFLSVRSFSSLSQTLPRQLTVNQLLQSFRPQQDVRLGVASRPPSDWRTRCSTSAAWIGTPLTVAATANSADRAAVAQPAARQAAVPRRR